MDAAFWLQRWLEDRIGFHQSQVNPFLKQYWAALDHAPGREVFVPLAGKSLDMLWLAERAPVLGVELSPKAVEDFFRENALTVESSNDGPFSVCQSESLKLYCGDFFDLEAEQLTQVGSVYDRAALIAMPESMRGAYVEKLSALLAPGTAMLLVTLDYDQPAMNGPPFAVGEAEVQARFAAQWRIRKLDESDVLAREARFRERGLSYMNERVYLLNKQ